LNELKSKCLEESIDVVIVGGQFNTSPIRMDEYRRSLEILNSIIKETLGFEPLVICGPKGEETEYDDVCFDTKKRRLYVLRPEDAQLHNDVFKPSEVEKMKKRWEKEEIERQEIEAEKYKK
jgi:hypothetical protein